MKYYSDLTKKIYETEEDLVTAEKELKEKNAVMEAEKEEKRLAAKKVKDLYKEANEKYKEADKALDEFCKKYKTFHYSFTLDDNLLPATSLFDRFFNDFWF